MKRSRVAGTVLLTTTLVTGLVTSATGATAASGTRLVSYHGYQIQVPADWRVVDLTAQPDACVRFDRPAVYLGRPGDQGSCPANLLGRTAGILVEPLHTGAAVLPGVRTAAPGKATAPSGTPSANGDIQLAVEDAGVLVAASHGADHEAAVRDVLATARLTDGGRPAKLVRPAQVQPSVTAFAAPGTLQGRRSMPAQRRRRAR